MKRNHGCVKIGKGAISKVCQTLISFWHSVASTSSRISMQSTNSTNQDDVISDETNFVELARTVVNKVRY